MTEAHTHLADVLVDRIGIAGTGRMAAALTAALHASGVTVVIAGRDPVKARALAQRIGSEAVTFSELPGRVASAIIAVSDDAIESVARELLRSSDALKLALHTSGAAGPDALRILREQGTATGVLHPLQTVPNGATGGGVLRGSAFAYAGDAAAQKAARQLIAMFQGKALAIDPARWVYYHAAAVMASNYQAALMDAALELMEGAGVARPLAMEALTPLFREAGKNVLQQGPEAALTGPIRRGDTGTVMRHVQALRTAPVAIRELYASAGLQTVLLAQRAGLPQESARSIEKALASASVQ